MYFACLIIGRCGSSKDNISDRKLFVLNVRKYFFLRKFDIYLSHVDVVMRDA